MSANVLLLKKDDYVYGLIRWLQDRNKKGDVLITVKEVKESYQHEDQS